MSDKTQEIADGLEALVKEVFPDAVRSVDKADVGLGFGKGYKGLVFVLSPEKGYVNLGIAYGAALEQEFPFLEGSGKVHRHVKIRALSDLKNPELKRLMRAAVKAARARSKGGG